MPDAGNERQLGPNEVPDVTSPYLRGYLKALYDYAWWKDGTLYVGSTGKTWREARDEVLAEHQGGTTDDPSI